MDANEYQFLAKRTFNHSLNRESLENHALHGMVGEIGEIHSLYQKMYQGHEIDKDHLMLEVGDLLWFVAEYCTVNGWLLGDVMTRNIEKLQARYPEGFDENRSLNRSTNDI